MRVAHRRSDTTGRPSDHRWRAAGCCRAARRVGSGVDVPVPVDGRAHRQRGRLATCTVARSVLRGGRRSGHHRRARGAPEPRTATPCGDPGGRHGVRGPCRVRVRRSNRPAGAGQLVAVVPAQRPSSFLTDLHRRSAGDRGGRYRPRLGRLGLWVVVALVGDLLRGRAPAQPTVVRVASSMTSATASGRDTVTAWDASISTVVEPARSAMNSIESAGMARS